MTRRVLPPPMTNGYLARAAHLGYGAATLISGVIHPGGSCMALITSFLAALRRDEEGQGLAEYALILALIAIVAIVALLFLGDQISTILSTVGASV